MKSHLSNTTAMNQGLESHIDDAHQMLKSTKAKLREILAQFEANQEDHGQPLDDRVSIVLDLIHVLGLIALSQPQYVPIRARLL